MPTKAQVLPTEIANGATPERVIEIADHDLARLTAKASQPRLHVAYRRFKDLIRVWDLCQIPHFMINRIFAFKPSSGIEQKYARTTIETFGQKLIHACQQRAHAKVYLHIKHA